MGARVDVSETTTAGAAVKDYKPKIKNGVDFTALDISPEEGFLLSRIDGSTSVENLTHLTGLGADRLEPMLNRLARAGAIEAPPAVAPALVDLGGGPVGADPLLAGPTLDDIHAPDGAERSEPTDDDGAWLDDGIEDTPTDDEGDERDTFEDEEYDDASDADDAVDAEDLADLDDELADDGLPPLEDEDDAEAAADTDDDDAAEDDDETSSRNYRRVYEETIKPLELDVRLARVLEADAEGLFPFCFDPTTRVVAAVLEHPACVPPHARLIAAHHHTSQGLALLGRKGTILRDKGVERALLKNPQAPLPLLRRLMQMKRLDAVYQLTLSRELTETVKRLVRRLFRARFQEAGPDDKANLVFKSEGRCLSQLVGLGFDGRTASLLCARPMHSGLLIQNLARFPATPPNVLVHMSKQAAVKRQPALKQMLLRHPNAPSQLKRE